MPGTIQVSVLDFNGLQSSSPSSQISIRVSMGKREYQTWDKGDFSFPLTTLRDNLIIALLDAEGNEISHTGVETRLIVEKGLWDEIFPLEGGGHVHMKLQFVLSEEERNRVRHMRESALKRKHEELVNISHRSPENATSFGSNVGSSLRLNHEVSDSCTSQNKVVAREADLASFGVDFSKNVKFVVKDKEGSHSVLKQMIPNDSDGKGGTSSATPILQKVASHLTEASQRDLVEKTETQPPPADVSARTKPSKVSSLFRKSEPVFCVKDNVVPPKLEDDEDNKLEKHSPLEKTPSNVRNMKSFFESCATQDMKPLNKSLPVKFQSNKIGMDSSLQSSHIDEMKTENIKPVPTISGKVTKPSLIGEFQQISPYKIKKWEQIGLISPLDASASSQNSGHLKELSEANFQPERTNADFENKFKVQQKKVDIKEEMKCPEDLLRSSAVEKAKVSGRILNEYSGTSDLFTSKQQSNRSLVINERGEGIFSKDSQNFPMQGVSNDKLKCVVYQDSEHFFESSGPWIFPDEAKRSCTTTSGKRVMDLLRGCRTDTNTHQGKTNSFVPATIREHNVHGGTANEVNDSGKTFKKLTKPKPESSEDVENSRGPFGQVMRVAIMVGFATLVLLTRQRKDR